MHACAEAFIECLKAQNFQFMPREDDDGDVIVNFPYKGKTTRLIFTGEEGRYVSLYLVYENVPADKTAEAIFVCNQLNSEYKWVKFYVDDDRDLMLQDDAILSEDSAAEEAMELLVRLVTIGEEAKPAIMRAIYA